MGGRAQSVKARQRREPAQRNPREVVVVQDAGGRHGLGEIYYGDRPSPTSEYLRAVAVGAHSRFAFRTAVQNGRNECKHTPSMREGAHSVCSRCSAESSLGTLALVSSLLSRTLRKTKRGIKNGG